MHCISLLFVVLLSFGLFSIPSTFAVSCDSTFDSTIDYFPIKSQVSLATGFSLEYFTSYKVVTNQITGEVFTLYICVSPLPNSSQQKKLFSVPLSKVASLDTTSVSFLEYLGERLSISAVASPDYVTSSCLLSRIALGLVNSSIASNFSPAGVQAAFGNYQAAPTDAVSISTSPIYETTLLKRAEWLKFYGAFYNLEETANKLFEEIQDNFNCYKELVQRKSQTKPTVAWVSFSDYGNASWSFSNASYKRDLTEAAGGIFYVPQAKLTFYALADFLDAAQNADVLIDESYFSTLGDATRQNVLKLFAVDTTTPLPNYRWINKVYREDGLVSSAYGLDWFDGAVVMADAVLADFIHVLYPSLPFADYQPVWFRKLSSSSSSPKLVTSNQCSSPLTSTTLNSLAPRCSEISVGTTSTTTGGSTSTGSTGRLQRRRFSFAHYY